MKRSPCQPVGAARGGFTLAEVLVSLVILLLIMLLMASMLGQANRVWTYNKGKTEEYRNAGDAFTAMTLRLSQATLNTYWDYVDSGGNARTAANSATFAPSAYTRQSELRFISGPGLASLSGSNPRPTHAVFFQAPLGYTTDSTTQGLENLLNTWGYYIEYGPDPRIAPSFFSTAPTRNRFRLMELMEPTNSLSVYTYTSGNPTYTGMNWFTDPLGTTTDPTKTEAHVLTENAIALVILPKLSPQEDPTGIALAPNYTYNSTTVGASTSSAPNAELDSKNQLPPVVQVSLVAISEESALRMGDTGSANLLAKVNSLFSQASNLTTDLRMPPNGSSNSLESYLVANRISYRIFTTDVAIKAAKWSASQTN